MHSATPNHCLRLSPYPPRRLTRLRSLCFTLAHFQHLEIEFWERASNTSLPVRRRFFFSTQGTLLSIYWSSDFRQVRKALPTINLIYLWRTCSFLVDYMSRKDVGIIVVNCSFVSWLDNAVSTLSPYNDRSTSHPLGSPPVVWRFPKRPSLRLRRYLTSTITGLELAPSPQRMSICLVSLWYLI